MLISRNFGILRRSVSCSWKLFRLEIVSHSTNTLTLMKKVFTKQTSDEANATQYTHQRPSWQVQILCSARMTLEREWQSWYRGGKSEWQNNQFFSSSENEPSLLYIHLRCHKQTKHNETKGYDLQKAHFFGKRKFGTFMRTKCARVKLHRIYFVRESILQNIRKFLSTTTSYSHWAPGKISVQELTGTVVCPDKNRSPAGFCA